MAVSENRGTLFGLGIKGVPRYPYLWKFASASCREAFGASRPGSGLLPPNPYLPAGKNLWRTPSPPALWDPPPPPIAWRSCKPMPWRVPPVGGSHETPPTPSNTLDLQPPYEPRPGPFLPFFCRNPLSSFPVLGPARLPRRRARALTIKSNLGTPNN